MLARKLIYLLVVFGVTARLAIAEEIPAIRPTKATGAGENRDTALRGALRNAVETGVGMYLDTESEVKNADLISDRILTHSQGYVESYQILKEIPGPIYRIDIAAQVKSLLIKQSLQNERLLPFEGTNVFANAVTNLDRQASAKQLISEALVDYPRGFFAFSVVKPSVRTERGKVFLDFVEISAIFKDAKLKRLIQALDQVALIKERAEKSSRGFDCLKNASRIYYIFTRIDEVFNCYKLDAEVYDEITKALDRFGGWGGSLTSGEQFRRGFSGRYGDATISILLKDADGALIDEKIVGVNEASETPKTAHLGASMTPIFQEIQFRPFNVEVDVDRVQQAKVSRLHS
jgi:hypothetical protein